jgi:hypothetical protein
MNAPKWLKSAWSGYPAAVALAVVFWALAFSSILKKSATSDETVHLAAGYSYWHHDDYRIDPENGNLPQRWMGLPFLFEDYTFPRQAPGLLDEWQVGHEFMYNWGNDPDKLLRQSRAMIAVLGSVLGLLVYGWSRRLFGPTGGLISLVLYVFSAAMLGNGSLGTSDLAASLCFLASTGCLWRMLHRVSVLTVAGSCLAMGLLFISKMSAPLIAPIGVLLCGVRLLSGRPLEFAIGKVRQVNARWRQAMIFLGAIVLHAAATWAIIWASYGFRYSIVDAPPDRQQETGQKYWDKYLHGEFLFRSVIETLSNHHLLPEGFLIGQAHVLKYSQSRPSFLNGEYGFYGWRSFFPYCFLYKTSLAVFMVLLLAAGGAWASWSPKRGSGGPGRGEAIRAGLYRTAPLWVLMAVYWVFAITSKMNIGHRHILPVYPPMFILAGAAAHWFAVPRRLPKIVIVAAMVFLVAECIWMWPHYLAYFNPLAGGPRNGYRHLVDSSLDWGQDTPGLKEWLDRRGLNNQTHTPVYLAYFGNGSPTHYGIKVDRLPGYVDRDLFVEGQFQLDRLGSLTGGVYCISASLLQSVLGIAFGPWSWFYEKTYQELLPEIETVGTASPERQSMLLSDPNFQDKVSLFSELQLARLCAYLRKREPDDHVGYSILIYRLSDQQAREATLGPPVELTPDRVPLRVRLIWEGHRGR